jgi:gluconokinase
MAPMSGSALHSSATGSHNPSFAEPADFAARTIIVMGVAGSGKTTVARTLASRVDFVFIDADWFHSPENIAKMSAGHPLSDDDRLPWLHAVGRRVQSEALQGRGTVTACSALKRAYRDVLRLYVADVFFVYLEGTFDVIHQRIESRRQGIASGSLLASQFADLQPLQEDERGMSVDVLSSPEVITNAVVDRLTTGREKPPLDGRSAT